MEIDGRMEGGESATIRGAGPAWRGGRGPRGVGGAEPQRSRLGIELWGRTKRFVTEVTIKLPMEQQVAQMASALRGLLEGDRD